MSEVPVARSTRYSLVLGALAFASTIAALMQTLVLPLLPQFPHWLNAPVGDTQWIATSTMLTGAIGGPLFGWLGDRLGMRPMIIASLGCLVVGAVLSVIAPNLIVMIAGRVLQGFAVGVTGLSFALIRTTTAAERLPWAVGIVSGTMGVGTGLGVPLAGLVVQFLPWQTVFWLSAGFGVLAIVLVAVVVPDATPRQAGRFDIAGAFGLSAVLVLFLLPLSMLTQWGLLDARTIGCLLCSVLCAVWWVRRELGVAEPFVDLRLASRRPVLAGHLVALLLGIAFFLSFTATVNLVQATNGLDGTVLDTALVQTPASILSIVAAPLAAILARRAGARRAVMVGAAITIAGFAARMVVLDDWLLVALTTMLVSGAASFAFAALPVALMRTVPVDASGSANGLNVMMRQIGAAGASVIGAIVLSASLFDGGSLAAGTFYWFFGLGAACSLGALLIMWRMGREAEPSATFVAPPLPFVPASPSAP